MPFNKNTFTDKFMGQSGTSSFQSQILFLALPFPFGQMRSSTSCFVKSLEGSMEAEAEAEAVDGRLKEAEAKEKLTTVASLLGKSQNWKGQFPS